MSYGQSVLISIPELLSAGKVFGCSGVKQKSQCFGSQYNSREISFKVSGYTGLASDSHRKPGTRDLIRSAAKKNVFSVEK